MKCSQCGAETYKSGVGWLVCSNEKCGIVFHPLSSEQHLELRNLIEGFKRITDQQQIIIDKQESIIKMQMR